MLCSTLVFNESVTHLSNPILNIIRFVNDQKKFITEENFIIMLLMNKVAHFGIVLFINDIIITLLLIFVINFQLLIKLYLFKLSLITCFN